MDEHVTRIAELKRKLAASMHAGKPMGGYEQRVEAIKAEIARLEREDNGDQVS